MKLFVNLFLFIFISFLSTPTIIGIVNKEVNISYFYNMCEEEENHAPFNEIKTVPFANYSFLVFSTSYIERLDFVVEHIISFDNLAHQIFSPPPNIL
ncbi:hypothetical protein NAT47_06555 [Flavobacterium sp. HXWNR69]|uniref:Uncharacterized protein n=1 Tax=Flavobacterium fragile TaxID=2949085 RepID=A0ABT0TI35_9FLAO|nr:hypothetical protein [Flavobacterium sp. HXWNR69]MCL9770070.1 hypothetical protein [Flavobacterium sp. HXWNR69]